LEGRNTFLPFPPDPVISEDQGRYAPVTAAAGLTLNTIDIHWTMSSSSDPEYVYRNSICGGQLF